MNAILLFGLLLLGPGGAEDYGIQIPSAVSPAGQLNYGTIAADDATPSVKGKVVWTTSANTGATAITDLDDVVAHKWIILIGGSNTNASTIADSGNFNLDQAKGAMTLSLDAWIMLYAQADNDYIEIGRGDDTALDDLTIATLTVNNTGLHILDTNASHDLIIVPGSDLTSDRQFTITTGDAARTLTMSADLTVESTSTVNQDLTTDASVSFEHVASTDDAAITHQLTVKQINMTPVCTIADGDATPSIADCGMAVTSSNTAPTAITDLDNPVAGQLITICGGSNTNSSTIADSGNFALDQAYTASTDLCLTLYVQADNDYVEVSRTKGFAGDLLGADLSDSTDSIVTILGSIAQGSATADTGTFTMIKGAQTGDPQVQLALTADGVGAFSVTTSGGTNGDITLSPSGGEVHVGADDSAKNVEIHSGGTFKMWDASDDTSVTCDVDNGTTELDITGSINVSAGAQFNDAGITVVGDIGTSAAPAHSAYVNTARIGTDSFTADANYALHISTAVAGGGFRVTGTHADAAGVNLVLQHDSASPDDGDVIGQWSFNADDSGGNESNYGLVSTEIQDPNNGSEEGIMRFKVLEGAGSSVEYLRLDGTDGETEIIASRNIEVAPAAGAIAFTGATSATISTTTAGLTLSPKTALGVWPQAITGDTHPAHGVVSAQSAAWNASTAANKLGAPLVLAGGVGQRLLTVSNAANMATDSLAFAVSQSGVLVVWTIVEGTDFDCAALTTLQCACNIYTDINAHTATSGLTAQRTDGTCSDSKVWVLPVPGVSSAIEITYTSGGSVGLTTTYSQDGYVECPTCGDGDSGVTAAVGGLRLGRRSTAANNVILQGSSNRLYVRNGDNSDFGSVTASGFSTTGAFTFGTTLTLTSRWILESTADGNIDFNDSDRSVGFGINMNAAAGTAVFTNQAGNGAGLVGVYPQTINCDADCDSPVTLTSNIVIVNCTNAGGCAMSLAESPMSATAAGTVVLIAGPTQTGALTLADSANVTELAGGTSWTPTERDTLTLAYSPTLYWVEVGRADNTP